MVTALLIVFVAVFAWASDRLAGAPGLKLPQPQLLQLQRLQRSPPPR